MIAKLKAAFSGTAAPLKTGVEDKKIATAALLIEAALSDEEYSDTERTTISVILKRHFSLSDADVSTLMQEAESVHSNADQILAFTRSIKENFDIEDRVQVIEMLWEIAYADGELSDYEANLVRRICGLIYVSDRDSGLARKRVLQMIGTPK